MTRLLVHLAVTALRAWAPHHLTPAQRPCRHTHVVVTTDPDDYATTR